MAAGDFWSDQERANKTIQALKGLKAQYHPILQFQQGLTDAAELLALTDPADEPSLGELAKDLAGLEQQLGRLEVKRLLGGDLDGQLESLPVGIPRIARLEGLCSCGR